MFLWWIEKAKSLIRIGEEISFWSDDIEVVFDRILLIKNEIESYIIILPA